MITPDGMHRALVLSLGVNFMRLPVHANIG